MCSRFGSRANSSNCCTPGVKCYIPTRVQMQALANKKAQSNQAALQQCIAELEEELAHERANVENMSQHGSNSRHHVSPSSEENNVETNHGGQYNEDDSADHSNGYEYMIVPRTNVAQPVQQPPQFSPISGLLPTTPQVQQTPVQPIAATPVDGAPTRNVDNHIPHDDLVGKEVVLYAILRADQPVAKGVIILSNLSSIVAGQALGKQYCEVVIKVLLKRDAKLPSLYPSVQEMCDAKDLSIAWPYCRLKVSKASKKSHGIGQK